MFFASTFHELRVISSLAFHHRHARTLAAKAGLPTTHKFVTVIRKKSDRDKLDAKPCPECQAVRYLIMDALVL